MKNFLLFITAIFVILQNFKCSGVVDFSSTLGHIKPKADPEVQAQTVKDLIARIIPEKADLFTVKVDPTLNENGKDIYKLEKVSDIIQITATTGVAAAAAFNHYLKYFWNAHISWEASQLNIPDDLPDVNLTITFNDLYRYYQNVCTTSYSFVWWDWTQWENHIDWMALNGFNFVLAFNAQEAIWERVYKKFNLTDNDINEHFTGPAFLAWLRMGNMRGFGGPLSPAWHSRSLDLQKKILERMRNLGIIPILPAFAGHLPRAFKNLYPDAKMDMMGSWNGFNDSYCCPYFLDPTESLFNEIGTAFINEMVAEFGTDHVYNCDSFNENTPSSDDLTYLSNVGQSIYKAMTDADPDAIWVMQGWLFHNDNFWEDVERVKALVTSVEIGKMIILDLYSEQYPQYERLEQYFGRPYIWCMLHNFGGTLGMWGSSTIINEKPFEARQLENSTMVGTGLTPEGINQNYVIYELMTESAWRQEPANLTEWFENYSIRRYGQRNDNATEAWRILQRTIYDYNGLNKGRGYFAITRSPGLEINIWTIWYSIDDLYDAWLSLVRASGDLFESRGYRHDLVDLTRQTFQVDGNTYYEELVGFYKANNFGEFEAAATNLLDTFDHLEDILRTDDNFLLGRWLQSAKNAANDSDEEILFEYNARNQITLWGPRGEILDYAIKQWSGVASNYLKPRWQLFIDYLKQIIDSGEPFDQSYISDKMFTEVEEPFTFDRLEFPVEPIGDTLQVVKKIYEKRTRP